MGFSVELIVFGDLNDRIVVGSKEFHTDGWRMQGLIPVSHIPLEMDDN